MKYFVYLLESKKDRQFYIGQTNDIASRLQKHNHGEVKSTAQRAPFSLLGYVEVASRKDALILEKNLKLHSNKKLKFIRKFKPDFNWNNTPR